MGFSVTTGTIADGQAALQGLLWVGGALGLLLIAFLVVRRWSRRMREASITKRPGFTLEQLRRLREVGKLTAAEYEAARTRTLREAGLGPESGSKGSAGS